MEDEVTLLEWARGYAAAVVDATDLAVDLDAVDWTVSTRAKRRAGATKFERSPDAAVGDPVDGTPRATVSLTLAAAREHGPAGMGPVLRHELVHVEQVQRFGTTDHGDAFRERAAAVDATRYCEPFADPAYRLRCRACSAVVGRRYVRSKVVKRPDDYRSNCCSAPLTVEETDA